MVPGFIFTIVCYSIYMLFKNFTDYWLKKAIIRSGKFENTDFLTKKVSSESAGNSEVNKYPTLKWGLVAFFGGLGLILIEQNSPGRSNWEAYHNYSENSLLPYGIEIVCISLGFLIYFFIVNFIKKK